MSEPFLDRRAFLAAAGVSAVAAAAGLEGRSLARRAFLGSSGPRTLSQAIRGPVIARGAPGFLTAAHVYNVRYDHVLPQAVARPLDTADVQAAVRWAGAHGIAVRARSGGHSYAGYSTLTHGVVLDLRNLRGVSFDPRTRTATVGAGAQLIDVYAALFGHGATIPAGTCPSVGVAGVTLGGGIGLAGRAFGLTADNLLAADLVTADGRLHHVDKHTDPGLLWALRGGGGGNFGIVTRFQFRTHRVPPAASWFIVRWPWSQASQAIDAWQRWAPHAPDQVSSVLHLQVGLGTPAVLAAGQYLGAPSSLPSVLAPVMAVPGASVSSGQKDYLSLQLFWANCGHVAGCHTVGTRPGGTLPRESFQAKSDYVSRPLPAAGRQAMIAAIEQRQLQGGSGALLCDSYGGAINRVAPGATAFVHRRELFSIQYFAIESNPAHPSGWVASAHAAMRPFVSGQAYQNYIDRGLAGWQHAYYGSNYARLLSIRRRVDPHHFFDFPQAIGR
jgi:FAD/FMN-containing dehydrogenase